MKKILDNIDLSTFNCDFVDVRIEETKSCALVYKNNELEQGIELPKLGAFVRVKNRGKWYYASTTDLETAGLETTIEELIRSSGETDAKKGSSAPAPEFKEIKNLKPEQAVFNNIVEKKELLQGMIDIAKADDMIINSYIIYRDDLKRKWYKNSKGTYNFFDIESAGVMGSYTIKEGENIFNSSYNKYGHILADFKNCKEEFRQDIEEAKLFLNAPTIEAGKYPVVLSEEVAGIFAHESFGHKSEADFMIGDESMKNEWEIGKKVGNEVLSIIDEGNIPGTSGYTPFDDEGVAKQKTFLIKDGILAGRLHSENTAEILEEDVTGNCRAIDFTFEPIVRMTNTYIGAGKHTFEELLSPIKDGFYIKKPTHGSGMSTFTIAVNRAYRIKNGKIAEPVKLNVISGSIFEALYKIDGLSNEIKILSFVGGGCGKMEQSPLPVGFGGPKVRVSEMMVS